ESGVGHAQKTPLKGKRFESLEEAQAYLDRWEKSLRRYPDPRHHQTTSRGHVRTRKTRITASAPRTVSLLPARPTGGASGWLRGSRSRLLWPASRLDRTARLGAVERAIRSYPRPQNRPAPARACTSETRRGTHQGVGPLPAKTVLRLRNYCGELNARVLRSARSATIFITSKASSACAAFRAFSLWPKSTVPRLPKMPVAQPWRWESANTDSYAAIWNALPQLSLRQVDPLIRELIEYRDLIHQKTREPTS